LLKQSHLDAFDSVIRDLEISAYLCGGTVRDMLLNRQFHDIDVVLSDRVFEAADLFRTRLNVPSFVLDHERQIVRVVAAGGNWDFSAFRNQTIEGDLRKRDFTINAIAVRWQDFYPSRSLKNIQDPLSGINDLKQRMIRAVTKESLPDDPLRMLRAYRISAELDFSIDKAVQKQIEELHERIRDVAAERITEELNRIFRQPESARIWKILGQTKLFDSLFPELKPMKGCRQGGYHHLDVWEHSVAALEHFEKILFQLPQLFPQHQRELKEYLHEVPGSLERIRLLKWACLLHDVGKPETRELKEPNRWRFPGHEHAGAATAERLLKRLKFARKDVQLISVMIEHHLRPLNLFNKDSREREDFLKFFRSIGAEAIGVLLISIGDISAACGPLAETKRIPEFIQIIREMLDYYYQEYYPVIKTPELIKGRDLMAVLQMKPGPLMGELLRDIREAQLSGELRNREEALDFAKNWLRTRS
jgi:poly(A) polymerase